MQTKNRLLVTGVSGHYGRLAASHLLEHHHPSHLIGTTRTPARARDLADLGLDIRHADFDTPSTLASAFSGAQRMLLTSTAAEHAGPRRVQQHRHAIDAARAAGVAHIVYSSFLAAEDSALAALAADHAATERALRETGVDHTVLRHAFYMEMLLPTVQRALVTGVLRTLDAHAGAAYVARADCALAGACALLSGRGGAVLDITGPRSVSPVELARIMHVCLGASIEVEEVSPDALLAGFVADGMSQPMAGILVYLARGMAQGAMKSVSHDFQRLTGREACGVEQFLMQHRDLLRAA